MNTKKNFVFSLVILLAVSIFSFASISQSQAKEASTVLEISEIIHFAGTIEIIYTDGTRLIIKTGEDIPVLTAGTIIRVLEGTITIRAGESISTFGTGEMVRVTTDAEGGVQDFDSPSKTVQGAKTAQLSDIGEEGQTEQASELQSLSPSTP